MVLDTIIIGLIIAIAIGVGLILWRSSAKAPEYDPKKVDMSAGFDPHHDHFSADHAKKINHIEEIERQEAEHRRQAAAQMSQQHQRAATQHVGSDWGSHLVPPAANNATASVAPATAAVNENRRTGIDRRQGERRNQ